MREAPTSRARALACLPALFLAASCAHGVTAFSVEPALACPGQTVTVRWEVRGRAALRAERAVNDWDEEGVPPVGERRLAVTQRTAFTLRALDANPADGHAFASKAVDVAQGPTERAAASTCDTQSGKCRGTFEIPATDAHQQVTSLAAPRIVRAGHLRPGNVCVSHPGLTTTCLGADDRVRVAVDAAGAWTLETDLPPDGPDPAPQLRVQLGFGCP